VDCNELLHLGDQLFDAGEAAPPDGPLRVDPELRWSGFPGQPPSLTSEARHRP
jgi:hypothetical protein